MYACMYVGHEGLDVTIGCQSLQGLSNKDSGHAGTLFQNREPGAPWPDAHPSCLGQPLSKGCTGSTASPTLTGTPPRILGQMRRSRRARH